jgi:hypothetical protein
LRQSSGAQTRPPIVEQIAKTYGLDSFEQIDAIRYTFNLQFPGVNLSRSWTCEPKSSQVTYEGKDKSVEIQALSAKMRTQWLTRSNITSKTRIGLPKPMHFWKLGRISESISSVPKG